MAVKILVVEDEVLIRVNIVSHLEDEGFDVYEAADADDAIAILTASQDIRLVFTDIDMPGSMDGLKLSAYVRDKWPPIRIIVTSGKRSAPVDGLPAGSIFFPKPYELATIARSIKAMTARM